MEQPKPPYEPISLDRGEDAKSKWLEERMRKGRVLVRVIKKDRLPFFLEAASANGFVVEEIARKGDRFPEFGRIKSTPISFFKWTTLEQEDCVVVSIEKPKGRALRKGFTPFWSTLKRLEQKQAQSSSNPPAKS